MEQTPKSFDFKEKKIYLIFLIYLRPKNLALLPAFTTMIFVSKVLLGMCSLYKVCLLISYYAGVE